VAGRWQWIVDDDDLKVGVTTSRRDSTTSTIVVADDAALLVDPAWDPDELDWIATDLAAAGITVAAGFATHAHHDHVLWHPGFGDGPRLASAQVAHDAAEHRALLVAALGPDWPAELGDLVGRLVGRDQGVGRHSTQQEHTEATCDAGARLVSRSRAGHA
jgi:glyoxylase-like metal-dependent hydrolase (beta-lactamase superfamily II)